MGCCRSASLPAGFKQIPYFAPSEENAPNYDALTKKIAKNLSNLSELPSQDKAHTPVRILVVAGLIVGIAVWIIHLNGSLTAFPQHFMNALWNINQIHLAAGAGGAIVLTIGASIVIHKVRHHKDRLIKTDIGKLYGDDHWIPILVQRGTGDFYAGQLDLSTLDDEHSGSAFIYEHKDPSKHLGVSFNVLLWTPLHMVGVIAYNLARVVIIPFYILGCILTKKRFVDPVDRSFEYKDITREIGKSLWRIVKAPFFAVAIIFATIYSIFQPHNGRKLSATLEREWNEGVTRAEGFWSVRGPQRLWKFEGGGSPSHLGKNGFYVAGCLQPIGIAYFEKGKLVRAESLSRAIDTKQKYEYKLITPQVLQEKHNRLVAELEQLKP
jgi:hypothetical protein